MRSELPWWRCHGRRIADVIVFCGGWRVIHIPGARDDSQHRLAAPARIQPEGSFYIALAADDVTIAAKHRADDCYRPEAALSVQKP